MSLGTITNLGLGSGLDLQSTLDGLKGIDESPIKQNEGKSLRVRTQASTLDSLNAKLMGVRSSALSLSLESTFLGRSVAPGKEDVVTATATDGIAAGNHTVEVQNLARKSAWQSTGFENASATVYPEPKTGLLSGNSQAVDTATELFISFGANDKPIEVSLEAGTSLGAVAEAINDAAGNKDENGEALVIASVVEGPNGVYVRMQAADPDEDTYQQILLTDEKGIPLSEENSPNFIKPDIAFSYRIGAENQPLYVSITAGSSYEYLVNTINETGEAHGIQASIVNDGSTTNGYRFTLTSRDTGEANRLFLDGLAMEEVQGGEGESLNAQFTVNGIAYERNSDKEIDDVIPGVSLTLQSEGTSTLTVKADYEDIKETIIEMMEGLIEFTSEVVKHRIKDPENEDEGLLNDLSSVKNIQNELNNLLSRAVGNGNNGINSLLDMGLSISSKGELSFDKNKLDEVLENNAEAVQEFFIGDKEAGVKGFGDILNEGLTAMTSDTSSLSLEKTNLEEKGTRLDSSVETARIRLERKYELMTLQFIAMDNVISALNSQADFMKNTFDAFTSANEK